MVHKITVVGAGVSGRALALWAAGRGASVFVTERRAEISRGTRELFDRTRIQWEVGGHTPECCECDLMVVSSGVSENSDAVSMARAKNVPVQGELDLLAPYLKGKIIAVTGTNGKTTCTALIAHLLQSAGLNSVSAGNIGEPLAAHADRNYDAIVMELSSFQLHWNTQLRPHVSILTNLAPDHLDWHGGYENYKNDKCKIFLPREGECYAVTHDVDAFRVPAGRAVCALGRGSLRIDAGPRDVFLIGRESSRLLFHKDALKLLGAHNLENAAMSCAAVALAFPEFDPSAGLSDFRVPPHRCEPVAERNGVLYIDDSKGTNVAAVITALRSIGGRKIVVLGGQGKGESYEALARVVCEETFAAIVIGSETEKILAALQAAGYGGAVRAKDMGEAVKKASELAAPGDKVLLSPACTSWDMYRSYEERGDHFAKLVRELSRSDRELAAL